MRGERLNDNVSEYLVDRIKHTEKSRSCPKYRGQGPHEGGDAQEPAHGEERTIETRFLFLCLGGVPNTECAVEVGVRPRRGRLTRHGPDLRRETGPPPESQ
jgi:thioredoxin reductase (NADPH)